MTPEENLRDIYLQTMDIPEPYAELSPQDKTLASDLLYWFESLEKKWDDLPGDIPHRNILRPMLLAKNGRFEESLAFTQQQYASSPGWDTAVALANAARRVGNLEKAIEMFSRATEYDPGDITCYLELGDIRLEQGEYQQALTDYEKVLAVDPFHQWALPSAFFCRHQLKIAGQWLQSLKEVTYQESCTCGLEGCLTEFFSGFGFAEGISRAEYLMQKLEYQAG